MTIKLSPDLLPDTAPDPAAGEDLYRSLFRNHHAVMLIIDPRTANIVDANKAAAAFYGYYRDDLVGMKITHINTLPEAEVFREMRRAKEGRQQTFYFRHRLAGGDIRDVEVSASPIPVSGQKLIYSVIQDITNRKRNSQMLEELVRQRTRELEDMNAALRVLLRQSENHQAAIEEKIAHNYELLIQPLLTDLKTQLKDRPRTTLVELLETSLENLVSPFSIRLRDPARNLTPTEIRTASLVRQGLTNKEIAQVMTISERTVSNHRYHIRKKLGLLNKKVNLRSYLASVYDSRD